VSGDPAKVVAAAGREAPEERPWLRWYGDVPASLTYPDITLYEAVAATAMRTPDAVAWDFMDTVATYREFLGSIDACADGLAALGVKPGSRILVAMPASPQGVIRTLQIAAHQMVVPTQHRVPAGITENAGRKGRLQGIDGGGKR